MENTLTLFDKNKCSSSFDLCICQIIKLTLQHASLIRFLMDSIIIPNKNGNLKSYNELGLNAMMPFLYSTQGKYHVSKTLSIT